MEGPRERDRRSNYVGKHKKLPPAARSTHTETRGDGRGDIDVRIAPASPKSALSHNRGREEGREGGEKQGDGESSFPIIVGVSTGRAKPSNRREKETVDIFILPKIQKRVSLS